MISIPVELSERSYDIQIEAGALERSGVALASLGDVSRVLLVTDENVDELYTETVAAALVDRGLDLDVVVIPAGEESKTIEMANSLWERFLEVGADRKSVAVALGGGVVGDLTGFVAATYVRGIRFFQIPTTLLAQVDSSVGGKTAVDLPGGKNMVGAFWQPGGVLIDPNVLSTLPADQYRAGLGEVVKYGASLDADFFAFLERNAEKIAARDPETLGAVVAKCCEIKAQIVSEDEFETTGRRALLNYGHTFGHALESALGYGTLLHGDGVSIGSLAAARLAKRLAEKGDARFSAVDGAWVARQTELLERLGLPTSLEVVGRRIGDAPETSVERLVDLMRTDKKAEFGKLSFVLPTALGQCVRLRDVSPEDAAAALAE
jgi:3-dehydroquinate synthase